MTTYIGVYLVAVVAAALTMVMFMYPIKINHNTTYTSLVILSQCKRTVITLEIEVNGCNA